MFDRRGGGGRGRQIPARISGDPARVLGRSEVAEWFDPTPQPGQPSSGQQAQASPPIPKGYDKTLVAPADYWSLGVLRPTNATYVKKSWRVTYSASGGDIITSSAGGSAIRTPAQAVTIITGWCFWAQMSAVGGPNASGVQTLAPDDLAYGSVNLTFHTGANSPEVTHHTLTGGKDVPGVGPGFFNQGLEDSPIELYVPGNTVLVARYAELVAPKIELVTIGFTYQGWIIDANLFYEHVDGPSR